MQPQPEPLFLTTAELSARWRGEVAPGTLVQWRHRKTGPTFVKLGGAVLYRVSDVVAWERQSTKATNDNCEPGEQGNG